LGTFDIVSVDEKMARDNPAVLTEPRSAALELSTSSGTGGTRFYLLALLLIAASVYLGSVVSPPSLMDDVDGVQAQIARTMLTGGDWVTPRIDGVVYIEKPPLIYWMIAGSYKVFGVSDWAARLPVALSAIALALLTAAFGTWAFGRRAGFYAGLSVATCVGLFLFTRIQIPDVMLTFTVALAMWAFLRVLDPEEVHPRRWAAVLAASLGVGLLLKSLIAVVFPGAAALIYLGWTKQLFVPRTWRRLRPLSGLLIMSAIALPWHILAALRNPPYFAWTMHGGPGQYHGFVWFYFINEQLLRFLNLRYPRDYNTVPRLYFWSFHLLWLFPWSVYLPRAVKLAYKPVDRASQTRLLALCWTAFVLVFFTFSTTQEYYSMPIYPALALLIGSAMATGDVWIRRGTRLLGALAASAGTAAFVIAFKVRNLPTPGDISRALSSHPAAYTLSLGHMLDVTFDSLAYLRLPLILAGVAFLVGAFGNLRWTGRRAFLSSALMMILFFQAARLALVAFDPFLSSRPLAVDYLKSPPGGLILDHHYYTFSSVVFYTDVEPLLLNGKRMNLEYGAAAPGAPNVFVDDSQFVRLWKGKARYYLVGSRSGIERAATLVGTSCIHTVAASGGKMLVTNEPLERTLSPE
jgi:4-amino-4-deoxy-L-arabinose transferase-like glycosyltransferase